jgi:hypothetical protein
MTYLACFDSRKQRQNIGQSENFIAGIFTFSPFAIFSAIAIIVFTDMVLSSVGERRTWLLGGGSCSSFRFTYYFLRT